MILVDTSVWIRALAGRVPYQAALDRLLDQGVAAGHELVYGELLIGDRGGRVGLLAAYSQISWVLPVGHAEVVAFARGRGLLGRGVGWIDVHLLAAALVAPCRLWTADVRLAELADEVGIAWSGT